LFASFRLATNPAILSAVPVVSQLQQLMLQVSMRQAE
jgi:hypothetical protein